MKSTLRRLGQQIDTLLENFNEAWNTFTEAHANTTEASVTEALTKLAKHVSGMVKAITKLQSLDESQMHTLRRQIMQAPWFPESSDIKDDDHVNQANAAFLDAGEDAKACFVFLGQNDLLDPALSSGFFHYVLQSIPVAFIDTLGVEYFKVLLEQKNGKAIDALRYDLKGPRATTVGSPQQAYTNGILSGRYDPADATNHCYDMSVNAPTPEPPKNDTEKIIQYLEARYDIAVADHGM